MMGVGEEHEGNDGCLGGGKGKDVGDENEVAGMIESQVDK